MWHRRAAEARLCEKGHRGIYAFRFLTVHHLKIIKHVHIKNRCFVADNKQNEHYLYIFYLINLNKIFYGMIFVKLNNAPMIRQNQHCGTVFFGWRRIRNFLLRLCPPRFFVITKQLLALLTVKQLKLKQIGSGSETNIDLFF